MRNIGFHNSNREQFICDALGDLVPFVQFKKREKNPWRKVNFSKVAGFKPPANTPPWVFFTFFKLYKWYQIAQRTTFVRELLKTLLPVLTSRRNECV